MRTKATLPLILGTLLTLLAVACGTRSEGPALSPIDVENAGIVNGTLEKSDSAFAKHTVALRSKNERDVFCTATVLSQRLLLTAAHCFEGFNFDRDEIEAVFDINADSANAVSIRVAKVRIHDDYTGFPKENLCPFGGCEKLTPQQFAGEHRAGDLALLLLKSDVPTRLKPVLIETQTATAGRLQKGMVAGYGASTFGKKFSQIGGYGKLRSMQARIEYFEKSAKFLVHATQQAVCFGDSGGPLFARVGDRFKQIGVASHLADVSMKGPCGASGAAYTSTAAYADWIRIAGEAIIAQKSAVEAPWLKIRLNRPKVLADGPEWFDSFVREISLICDGSDARLNAHARIEPYFKGAQFSTGEPGTGVLSAVFTRGTETVRFNFFQRGDEEAGQFNLEFKDASDVWKKTNGRRDKAYAAALDGGAHEFSIFQSDLQLTVETSIQKPFRIARSELNFIEMKSASTTITLTDLNPAGTNQKPRDLAKTQIPCVLRIDMLPHR